MSEVWYSLVATLLVLPVGFLGTWLGVCAVRNGGRTWIWTYLAALAVILAIASPRIFPAAEFSPLYRFLFRDRMEFAAVGFFGPLLMTPLVLKVPARRLRILLTIFSVLVFVAFSIVPFLSPVLSRPMLARLKTTIDSHGVCIQGTGFTCGPAAAVTGLRTFGIFAEEADLARKAFTSSWYGTMPDVLASVLSREYAGKVAGEYRYFESVADMKGREPVLAIIKLQFPIEHYVTVLQVSETEVKVGDPLSGISHYSIPDFEKVWRKTGVQLRKIPGVPM